MLSGKLLDRGIHPKDANKKAPRKMPKTRTVKVIGGESTPMIENMAMIYAQRNAKKHLKKKTESTDKGIDFWFQEE